jgi:hypothetical protein
MRIRITRAVPVNKKHGITVGREFEAKRLPRAARGKPAIRVKGEAGRWVYLMHGEYEIVGETKDEPKGAKPHGA